MSKDPAFLFYSSDFLTGTMFFSDEQTGKYIRLLCAQHQKGRLYEKDMLKICKTYDEDIFDKFIKDKNGLFYNERLENETIKRKKYSESRRQNRLKSTDKKNICKTYDKHMENENEIDNVNKKDNIPTLDEFLNHAKTLEIYRVNLDYAIKAKYKTWVDDGWKDGNGNKIKNWKNKLSNTLPHLKAANISSHDIPIF